MTAYHHICITFLSNKFWNGHIRIEGEVSLPKKKRMHLVMKGIVVLIQSNVREFTGVIDRASEEGWEFISSERPYAREASVRMCGCGAL